MIRHHSSDFQNNGSPRRHADLRSGRRTTVLHPRCRGSRAAAFDRHRCGQGAGAAARRASPAAHHPPCRADARRRSLPSPLSVHSRPTSRMPRVPSPAPNRRACCASTSMGHSPATSCCPVCRASSTPIPTIVFHMSEGDRLADLMREGIDCVLRVGEPRDTDMVAPSRRPARRGHGRRAGLRRALSVVPNASPISPRAIAWSDSIRPRPEVCSLSSSPTAPTSARSPSRRP